MGRRETLADRLDRRPGTPILEADARHRHQALGLDEDLPLLVGGRPDDVPQVVVRPAVPGAVPGVGLDRRGHRLGGRAAPVGFGRVAGQPGERLGLLGREHEEPGDEDGLGDSSGTVGGRLEGVAGPFGEDIEVETVVPVRAPDQWEPVWTEPVQREPDRSPQVVAQRRLRTLGVVPRHGDVEDREIAGLLDVRGDGDDQPRRIVIEAGPDVVVAALRERLVLVIRAAIGQLRGGDIEDPSPGTLRDDVDEPQQVLVRVPEPHPPADARLEHRRRAGQVEGHHALVGIPGVDHAIDVLVARRDLERPESRLPRRSQGGQVVVDLGRRPVELDDGPCARRVRMPRTRRIELAVWRVLRVAEQERHVTCRPRRQLERGLERTDRLPAVGGRPGRGPALDRERPIPASVRAEEGVARGIEPLEGRRAAEPGEVVAALAVLGEVEHDAVLDQDLARGQVALEVRRIVLGVP